MSMPVAETGHPDYAVNCGHDMQMRDELRAAVSELEAVLGEGSERQQSEQDEYDDPPENAADEHAGLGFRSVVLRNILLNKLLLPTYKGHCITTECSHNTGQCQKQRFLLGAIQGFRYHDALIDWMKFCFPQLN